MPPGRGGRVGRRGNTEEPAQVAEAPEVAYRLCYYDDTLKLWTQEVSLADLQYLVSGGMDMPGDQIPLTPEQQQTRENLFKELADRNTGLVKREPPTSEALTPVHAFILPEHVERFLKFADNYGVWISVRDTGSASLRRIREGMARKPHEILEKSLKASSLGKVRKIREAWIKGLLGPSSSEFDRGRLIEALKLWSCRREQILRGQRRRGQVKLLWQPQIKSNSVDGNNNQSASSVPAPAPADNGLPLDGPEEIVDPVRIASILDPDPAQGVIEKQLAVASEPRFAGVVGWWGTLTLEGIAVFLEDGTQAGTMEVPIGILHVGPKKEGHLADWEHGCPHPFAEFRLASTSSTEAETSPSPAPSPQAVLPPRDGYTGDYDLHCIFVSGAGGALANVTNVSSRPASAPTIKQPTSGGEDSPYEEIVDAEPDQDTVNKFRQDLQALSIILNFHYLKLVRSILTYDRNESEASQHPGPRREKKDHDRYASLIQHGPQNLFYRYQQGTGLDLPNALENLMFVTEQIQNIAMTPGLAEKLQIQRQRSKRKAGRRLFEDLEAAQAGGAGGQPQDAHAPAEPESLTDDPLGLAKRFKELLRSNREKLVPILLEADNNGVLAFTLRYEGEEKVYQNVYILHNAEQVRQYYLAEKLNVDEFTMNTLKHYAVLDSLPVLTAAEVLYQEKNGNRRVHAAAGGDVTLVLFGGPLVLGGPLVPPSVPSPIERPDTDEPNDPKINICKYAELEEKIKKALPALLKGSQLQPGTMCAVQKSKGKGHYYVITGQREVYQRLPGVLLDVAEAELLQGPEKERNSIHSIYANENLLFVLLAKPFRTTLRMGTGKVRSTKETIGVNTDLSRFLEKQNIFTDKQLSDFIARNGISTHVLPEFCYCDEIIVEEQPALSSSSARVVRPRRAARHISMFTQDDMLASSPSTSSRSSALSQGSGSVQVQNPPDALRTTGTAPGPSQPTKQIYILAALK